MILKCVSEGEAKYLQQEEDLSGNTKKRNGGDEEQY